MESLVGTGDSPVVSEVDGNALDNVTIQVGDDHRQDNLEKGRGSDGTVTALAVGAKEAVVDGFEAGASSNVAHTNQQRRLTPATFDDDAAEFAAGSSSAMVERRRGSEVKRRTGYHLRDPQERRSSLAIATEHRADSKLANAVAPATAGPWSMGSTHSQQLSSTSLQSGAASSDSGSSTSIEESERGKVGHQLDLSFVHAPDPVVPAGSIGKADPKPLLIIESAQPAEVAFCDGSLSTDNSRSAIPSKSLTERARAITKEEAVKGAVARVKALLHKNHRFNDKPSVLTRACLNPNYFLRNQLFLSFGTVSAVALIFVVLTAIITASVAGNAVKRVS
jgi:hypothetical protein